MDTVIRVDLQKMTRDGRSMILELGCGDKPVAGRINVDRLDFPHVDVVTDIEQGLAFLPDRSVDEIHSNSFFEHVGNFELLMREIVRVLKDGGKCVVSVPHFSNPYFYSDYTHKKFFGLYTFYYFVDERHQLARKVPNFYTEIRIKIESVRFKFVSPFRRRNWLKGKLGMIINWNRFTKEFYEENLCHLLPCYALEVVFTPDRGALDSVVG